MALKKHLTKIQVLNKNQIAYQNFAFDFTLIDQKVYDIITN